MKGKIIPMLIISLVLGTLVFGVSATSPVPIITVDFECVPALAAGVPVGAYIGGPNCNCPKSAVTGFTDASGNFTAKFDLAGCHPGTGKCFAYVTAGGPPEPCKGRADVPGGSASTTVHVKGAPTPNPPAQRQP